MRIKLVYGNRDFKSTNFDIGQIKERRILWTRVERMRLLFGDSKWVISYNGSISICLHGMLFNGNFNRNPKDISCIDIENLGNLFKYSQ